MKKFLCLILSMVMVLGCTITVYATEVNVPATGEVTGSTPSSFTVDDNMIPEGVVLRIPATLNPVYDANIDAYTVKDVVSVTGGILDTQEVSVSVDSEITYQLADSEETATGYVKFGPNGVETWNASEVALGATDLAQADTRNIIVNIPSNSYGVAGSYTGTCEFDVNIGTLGLYGSICPPCKATTVFTINKYTLTNHFNTAKWTGNKAAGGTSVALQGVIDYVTAYEEEYPVYFGRCISSGDNETVKYIEMVGGNEVIGYETDYEPVGTDTGTSWLNGFIGVKVIVVPSNIRTEQLYGKWVDGTWTQYTVDYTRVKYTGTNIVMGNALVFAKGTTGDNLTLYVPHIVYRGTMEQWKALSGSTDWVFGNAANVVQVHCTDGDLIY